MLILMLILFAAFAACVLGQLYIVRQVRRVLVNKHPQAWLDLSSRAFFVDNAVFRFVWKKGYASLGDPELDQLGRRMRYLQVVSFVIWLAYAASIFMIPGQSAPGGG